MILISTSRISNYWERFPFSLRLIIKARLWTAIGAGGVLYLSPIIFNGLGFRAEQIGSGITCAALAGIMTRLGTGYLLDKKYSYRNAIKVACCIAIISDFILYLSQNYLFYLFGQFFLGAAAGIYWPSIELAIPLNCNNKGNSSEAYALARSADAIGITIGVLIGTIGTYFHFTRIIYLIDIVCMIYIFKILSNTFNITKDRYLNGKVYKDDNQQIDADHNWIIPLLPLLFLTLFVTGVMTLLQSLLPLDIANGGIERLPLKESQVATLVSIKLLLLAIFQWPVGYLIRNRKSSYKFQFCLITLLIGFIILSLSSFLINGYILIIISFIPLTIALCIFLPSASDSIIRSSPIKYQGKAIALYSQCFGISALTIPWMAGKLIDSFGSAIQLWIIISLLCIFILPICKRIV